MPEVDAPSSSPNESQPARAPLVSVIIPVFNAASFIRGALESVFAQSFTDYEVILINDGSSDTVQLEKAIQPYASRIVYLTQENRGPSAARNTGIRQARGAWLAFLDGDDTWLPNYLAEQLRFLTDDPSLDMVYCDARLEGDTNLEGKTFMQVCPSSGAVTFESLLFEKTQVITSGTVVRTLNVTMAGLFDKEIHCSEDHDLWLRVVHTGGKIAYQQAVLLRRNIRCDSQGSAQANLLTGEIQTLKKLNRDLDLSPHTRAMLAQRLREIEFALAYTKGKEFLLAGNRDQAYESLNRANALATNPRLRAALISLRIAPRLTVLIARFWHSRKSSKAFRN